MGYEKRFQNFRPGTAAFLSLHWLQYVLAVKTHVQGDRFSTIVEPELVWCTGISPAEASFTKVPGFPQHEGFPRFVFLCAGLGWTDRDCSTYLVPNGVIFDKTVQPAVETEAFE
jgi:hypothetical protein